MRSSDWSSDWCSSELQHLPDPADQGDLQDQADGAVDRAKLVVNDFFRERAEQVAQELNSTFGAGTAIGIAADVTDAASVTAMATAAQETFGTVDILVNNAGNAGPGQVELNPRPFWEQDPAEWDRWIKVNFNGVMLCCRYLLPAMVEKGAGAIVNVISDAGRVGDADLEPYSGATAATAGFSRALARKLGRPNVRVKARKAPRRGRGGPNVEN